MGGLSGLGGLGALASGFQQGTDFVQDVQYKRQRKKALDFSLNQMGREDAAAQANSEDISDEERAFYGDDTAAPFMPDVGEDPFLYRFVDFMAKRRGKKGKRKQALSGSEGETGAPPPEMPVVNAGVETTPYVDPNEGVAMYGDGGEVKDEEDDGDSAIGRFVKGTNKLVAKKAKGAYDEVKRAGDITSHLLVNPLGLRFWSAPPAEPTAPAAVSRGTPMPAAPGTPAAPLAPTPAAAQPRTQALPSVSAQAAVARTGSPTAPRGVPSAPARPQPGDAIDMSQVDIDASELPDIKMSDWKRYRAQALRTARMKGLPQAQALEEADRLVTTMQIRGFSNYASQAQALLGAGNVKGALRSLRAAYQYFPDGNDVKLGVQNGKIIAVGVDEGTGKPFEGGTRVITPEFLAGAIQNFQNPQNFLAWTNDWRDEAFKRQKYEEVEKPLAEAQGQALRTNAEANVARSEAAALRASLTQRGGGLKPADMARSEAVYRERLQLMGVTDEAQADTLAALMSQIKQANPTVPDNMIADFVMKAQARPDGEQFIQRALSGQ